MSEALTVQYGDRTLDDFIALQERGRLNLEPGFQRKSVWNPGDRRKLIESLLQGYPIPSIFLYRREEDGNPVYDVIDGKQRLETIFMFTRSRGFGRHGFQVKFQFSEDDQPCWYDWRTLRDWDHSGPFLSYKVQTVEVSGELSDIVDLFVRINSTGKALTSSEKRHAKFCKSPFLKEAERLARLFRSQLTRMQVMNQVAISRMKDVEVISELLASIVNGGPIHKKAAVDRVVGNRSINSHTLRRAVGDFGVVLRALGRMFPELRTTRFRNVAEFYTLFMLVWEMHNQRLILTDRRRNRAAQELLKAWSSGVDRVRELQRQLKPIPASLRPYSAYLLLVQQSTDQLHQRKARAEMLRGLLGGLFERKDDRRLFTPEQRRLLWSSEEKRACSQCKRRLDWTSFQVDHIRAHSRGGLTDLRNAALICQSCNASKGARSRARRAAA